MELFYFHNQDELNNFIKSAENRNGAEFLETWVWGEIAAQEGKTVLRVGVRDQGRIQAAATLIKTPLFGPSFYWYSPRGPIGEEEASAFLAEAIKKIAGRAVFWRFEPSANVESKEGRARIKKTLNLQPAQTLFLDLGPSEEELLATMHQKTRYNIRLAEKKGVQIKIGDQEDISEFNRLLLLTGERDGFRLHSASHYENLLKTGNGSIRLFLARYQDRNIAAALVSFFGGRATYLHGASDNASREVMAPQLLQWEIIRSAKKEGYQYYDFYGLDEAKWPGVTRFKLGFGGRTFDYPGTFDFVYRPLVYRLYNGLRSLKRFI